MNKWTEETINAALAKHGDRNARTILALRKREAKEAADLGISVEQFRAEKREEAISEWKEWSR